MQTVKLQRLQKRTPKLRNVLQRKNGKFKVSLLCLINYMNHPSYFHASICWVTNLQRRHFTLKHLYVAVCRFFSLHTYDFIVTIKRNALNLTCCTDINEFYMNFKSNFIYLLNSLSFPRSKSIFLSFENNLIYCCSVRYKH